MLLASVAFAVGAARMARRGALVQRLSAVESLAGVDVVCVDKTGTLTDGTLALDEIVPLGGHSEAEVRAELGAFATSLAGSNPTADAIAEALGGVVRRVQVEVPFSSRWKWSGLTLHDGETQVLGAPDVLLAAGRRARARSRALVDERAREQRRVLLFARARATLSEPGDGEPVVPALEPIGLVALTERMRDQTAETIAFLRDAGIAVKVISGDGPVTVEAVARAAGLETTGRVITGSELPREPRELGLAAERCVVFARIQPDQKRALVEALGKSGRRVAMVGDGVNDVPALKASQVAIALGSGSQIAKGVADLVLVGLNFAAIPAAVEEGRKILRNVRRVAKLFVAKSVFAAVLILTVGIAGGAYPFLPRQLSLAAAFTVGLPTFFLALAPPPPERRGRGFLREILAFAVPAGMVLGFAVLLGHGLVHGALEPLAERVADHVDDDPDLRRALPRARARVDGHAHVDPPGACDPRALHRARRDLRRRSSRSGRRAATSRSRRPLRCRCSFRSSARSSRSARSARSASRSRGPAASACSSSCRSADRPDHDFQPRRCAILRPWFRGVAQLGSALRSGRRGPQFKSGHPDREVPIAARNRSGKILVARFRPLSAQSGRNPFRASHPAGARAGRRADRGRAPTARAARSCGSHVRRGRRTTPGHRSAPAARLS